jgi:superfamily II DNA helicase RecQ
MMTQRELLSHKSVHAADNICVQDGDEQGVQILRKLLKNSQATWKSPIQQEATRAVQALITDVMVIMSTGGGKTMVPLIPTLVDGDITVFVLPLNSLIVDYKRKLKDMGVVFDHFDGTVPNIRPDAQVVLVSVDRAQTQKWYNALSALEATTGSVTRMVFDEAHLALTENDFRKTFTELSSLRSFRMQFVLLTGTCPPSSEKALAEAYGLIDGYQVYRETTNRPELQYLIEPPCRLYKQAIEKVVAQVKSHMRRSHSHVLVFVQTLEVGEEVAELLDCGFYHGKVKKPEERQKIYMNWFSGKNKVLVATSALSAGTDCPTVDLVVHLGAPQEMVHYVQEVSRGGRRGQATKCVLYPVGSGPWSREIPDDDHKGLKEMAEYTWGKRRVCLRKQITAFCDGKGQSCRSSPSNQRCVHCLDLVPAPRVVASAVPAAAPAVPGPSRKRKDRMEAFAGAAQAVKQRRIMKEMSSLEYVNRFRSCLNLFNAQCPTCLVHGSSVLPHSKFFACPFIGSQHKVYKDFKAALVYKDSNTPDTCCFFCHIPQADERLHKTFTGRPSDCEYPDIVAPVAFAIFGNIKIREAAQAKFGVSWQTMDEFVAWLNGPTVEGARSNITALFMWYCNEFHSV